MNNTIRHLPNGDFEVVYPTPEQIAAQEQYVRERQKVIGGGCFSLELDE